ncbi:hypothetical protein JKF63_03691 [Porcisia hertigi]|uniref:Uncharacterized protein n=1 Tax=Porcisia hertigi TaxID=2761500 RepID=A0A836HX12_9TRYP|nr:hypothetical protein JKF63_03691 [Porcisia hertigi]
MSWTRDEGDSYPLPRPQRDASPPPELRRCTSQPAPSTPMRVFGSEITNRIPTLSPPQSSPSPSPVVTETLRAMIVDVSLAHAPLAPTSSFIRSEADSCQLHSSRDDKVSYIPSYETLLGAISNARTRQGSPSVEDIPSSSASSSDHHPGSLVRMSTARVGGGLCLAPIHAVVDAQKVFSVPPESCVKRVIRGCDTEDETYRTDLRSSRPQAKRRRGEGATASLPPCPPFPVQGGGVGDPGAADGMCVGNDADVISCLVSSSESNVGGSATRRGVDGFPTPVSTKMAFPLAAAPAPLLQSRRLHMRTCCPASLLDREYVVPLWQRMTPVPVTTTGKIEGPGQLGLTPSNTTLCFPARGNVLLCNEVDDSIVYSPRTLDDITPILSLSEDRLEWRPKSAAACTRHSLTEVKDEGQRLVERSVAAAPCTSPRPLCALTLDTGDAKEESAGGTAPRIPTQCFTDSPAFIHEEVLRFLTASSEGALSHSL